MKMKLLNNQKFQIKLIWKFWITKNDLITDLSDVPSLGELQLGLLNEPRHVPALLRLTKILLTLVLEYPGAVQAHNGQQAKTNLGQTVRDLDVTSGNLSELLRIYLSCRDAEAQNVRFNFSLASLYLYLYSFLFNLSLISLNFQFEFKFENLAAENFFDCFQPKS